MNEVFHKVAHKVGEFAGNPWSFVIALSIVIVWLLTGPMFGFSDTWQLVINTGTTIVTFLMVFLIQNMQNRDAKAVHLKLDELIHSIKQARNDFIDLEDTTEEEISKLANEFKKIRTDRLN
ncbi:hypothetical protein A3C57_01400 [Candidatus Nomurabacteria bacterium RIFCSPHIGHO2_02_FULL_33_12]|nr:MAG: hypothetical protein A3C57_01400 [Candidatus Nomurabacteria bacterium RIFCSPHIGHO2_02_FULL_33_12]